MNGPIFNGTDASVKYFDKLKLISCIYERRILWDQKCDHYFERNLVKSAWNDVAKELGFPVEECRKKWRNLRDIFTKEFKKQDQGKKRSTWRYMKFLMFLSDHIKTHQNTEDYSQPGVTLELETEINPEEFSEQDGMNADPDDNKDLLKELTAKEETESNHSLNFPLPPPPPPPPKRPYPLLVDIDEDYHFLMSILPTMRSLPQKRKNIVRSKILQILCEENV